jgi:hypothetical protein
MYNKDGSMISDPVYNINNDNNFTNTFIINSESTEIKYIRVVIRNEQGNASATDPTYYINPSNIKSVEITEV